MFPGPREGLYFRASRWAVARPPAGYHYGVTRGFTLVGLSPASWTANFAAPSRPCSARATLVGLPAEPESPTVLGIRAIEENSDVSASVVFSSALDSIADIDAETYIGKAVKAKQMHEDADEEPCETLLLVTSQRRHDVSHTSSNRSAPVRARSRRTCRSSLASSTRIGIVGISRLVRLQHCIYGARQCHRTSYPGAISVSISAGDSVRPS